MLRLMNDLAPFFEDCYRRINVREYARIMNIAPATASKTLQTYKKECILKKEEDKRHHLFYAQKESHDFIDLSRIYWRQKLEPLLKYFEKELLSPTIILFGSLAKGEAKKNSDVDLAIIAPKKEIDIKPFEKSEKRTVQLFWFDNLTDIKSKELRNNIIKG